LITINESTCLLNSSTPFWACCVLLFPSNWNGIVTIPTVKISISFAIFAIIGAAPVPVPPPIPAVIKTILVCTLNICWISWILSAAACAPISGFAPAPKPDVKWAPNWILLGIGLFSSACASVLQITKSTPWICLLYIWFTALLPPPPTPITLMALDCDFGMSNEMLSNSSLIIITILFYTLMFDAYPHKLFILRCLKIL